MPVLIEKIKTSVNHLIRSLQWKIEYLRERLEGFLGVYRVDTEHVYSQEENELIDKSVEVVQQFFPEPPGAALLQEDFESRCEVLEDFAARLKGIYGMEGIEVIITDDSEVFPSEGGCVFGITRIEQRTVYINANLLQLEDEAILAHLVGTVIHELRHVMQYEIMTLVNTHGVPYQRRKAWRYNLMNYVSNEYDMEAYVNQPIEFDARNFTNRIWRGAYQKNIPLGGY